MLQSNPDIITIEDFATSVLEAEALQNIVILMPALILWEISYKLQYQDIKQ